MYCNGGGSWCASRYPQAPTEIEAPSLSAAAVPAVLFNIIYSFYIFFCCCCRPHHENCNVKRLMISLFIPCSTSTV